MRKMVAKKALDAFTASLAVWSEKEIKDNFCERLGA